MIVNPSERWLIVKEACQLLGISRSTFYELLRQGRVTPHSLGAGLRKKYDREELLKLLQPETVGVAK